MFFLTFQKITISTHFFKSGFVKSYKWLKLLQKYPNVHTPGKLRNENKNVQQWDIIGISCQLGLETCNGQNICVGSPPSLFLHFSCSLFPTYLPTHPLPPANLVPRVSLSPSPPPPRAREERPWLGLVTCLLDKLEHNGGVL